VQEQFTITTANLVFFGVGKAVFNFAVGVLSDIYGRKWAIIIGWLCAIPMPFMVCVCVYVYIYIYAGRV
jgi:MFS family permease